MDTKLFSQAIVKFLSGLLIVGLLLFLPAGTFTYWQAWLLIGILFIPMFIAGLIMMKKSPDLLRKRLDVKEEQSEQKAVIALSGLMFLAAFIVAGLNIRFGWILLPGWVSFAAAVLFLSMPLVLGSVLSFVITLAYIPIIAKRIRNEEQVLENGLEGYTAYKKRVKYKVIPFVW